VSDYTIEMFYKDHNEVIPIFAHYQDLETLNRNNEERNPEKAVLDVVKYFVNKYGKARGTDYEIRFLSIYQFIEHYQKDLLEKGLISYTSSESTQIPNSLLETLLDSFRPPQPPNPMPSSSLFNERHEFNYKKVLKTVKSGDKN
jgi:hypothetical protein